MVAGRFADRPECNLTLRVDEGVLLWARMRALRSGTSVNRLIRGFLEEYAAVPHGWWEGLPPPWDEAPDKSSEGATRG